MRDVASTAKAHWCSRDQTQTNGKPTPNPPCPFQNLEAWIPATAVMQKTARAACRLLQKTFGIAYTQMLQRIV